ncbi:hypothetical protein C0584_03095 [Candidatus Parcubacteria bacterium]|nr:MAG: hypothetical protein C0584_03095 [Candidatus Parcubacteria bacterium]
MKEVLLLYIEKNKKIVRFVLSGSSATTVDLFLLFFLTDIFGFWYLHSALFALSISFFVSFYLQKYWTFEDERMSVKTRQMLLHFLVACMNLTLNTLGLFLLVDLVRVHYLVAQLIVVSILGMGSFLIYNIIIFKKSINEVKQAQ